MTDIEYSLHGQKGKLMTLYIGNAFSLQMLQGDANINVRNITQEEASSIAKSRNWESCVGHADTAAIFSDQLGVEVSMNRISLKVDSGDQILVGQLVGGRLPEGATTLPYGFSIKWMMVTIE